MLRMLLILSAAMISTLAGCTAETPAESNAAGMPGSDKDEYGCIASAGYAWCERTKQCERPWELAEREGLENTDSDFQAYCNTNEP